MSSKSGEHNGHFVQGTELNFDPRKGMSQNMHGNYSHSSNGNGHSSFHLNSKLNTGSTQFTPTKQYNGYQTNEPHAQVFYPSNNSGGQQPYYRPHMSKQSESFVPQPPPVLLQTFGQASQKSGYAQGSNL